MIDIESLGEVEQGILEEAYESIKNERKKSQAEISRLLEKDPSQISRAMKRLEEQELIKREDHGRTKKVSLTDKGAKTVLHLIAGTEEELNNLLSLHNFSVKIPITNLKELEDMQGDDWREHYFNHKEIESIHDPSNDTYRFKESEYKFRITRENVIIVLNELVGNDPQRLKTRAYARAMKGAGIVEDLTPIKLRNGASLVTAEIANQHLALMNDPLSNIVNRSDEVGTHVKIFDKDGKLLFWTDDSGERKDLEAGDRGKKGMSEDNIQKIMNFYSWIVQNDEIHRKARKWMEEEFA